MHVRPSMSLRPPSDQATPGEGTANERDCSCQFAASLRREERTNGLHGLIWLTFYGACVQDKDSAAARARSSDEVVAAPTVIS